jgi:hypothetical protein
VVVVLLLFTCEVKSQEQGAFLELGGNGGLVSINYERWKKISRIRYYNSPPVSKARHVLRAGMGLALTDDDKVRTLTFPIMYQLVYGADRKSHRIELGFGFAPYLDFNGAFALKSPMALGYRYWNSLKRLFIRVTYTPNLTWSGTFHLQHWAGVTFGYQLGEFY